MRLKSVLLAACAVASANAAMAEDEIDVFKDGLTAACQKWLNGSERKGLSKTLKDDGWDVISDAIFTKPGDHGRVTVVIRGTTAEAKPNPFKDYVKEIYGPQPGDAPKRGCEVQYSNSADPWTIEPATTAAATWIADVFPNAQRKKDVTTKTANGQTADGTLWSDGKVKITQVAFKAKQSEGADLLLKVEPE